ncbi:hypothetical protein [Williamsia sp. D3]|uniref:hypothetical protein n=1 Tax=Williamsia sp. D3 TaxID=1313067 RepID=UPI0003D2FABF|nr:hypothetical protein [Williamsia sp. D3]ETD31794.1 hypothetical protein W823_17485 [Williamsia sp. D3]
MSASRKRMFWRLWTSSLLWAIPAAYVLSALGVATAFVLGLIYDGHPDALGDYARAALVGFFFWGTIIFIGTCYITIPLLSLILAVVRYAVRVRQSHRLAESPST